MRMPSKLFADDDDNQTISTSDIDKEFGDRLIHNRNREDLQRYEELKKRGLTNDSSDSESESEEDDVITDSKKELMFFNGLLKVKKQDPCLKNKDVKLFESVNDDVDINNNKKKKKEKKLFLKDVQGVVEEEEEKVKGSSNKSFVEEQEELRQAVFDAMVEEDGEDLFKEKEEEKEEEDEELAKTLDEYFVGDGAELDEGKKFLRDYFGKQLWKEDGVKGVIDLEAEEDDEDAVEDAEEYELNYRHEENAGEVVMGHSRKVEGSVRKKDTARNVQRKNKEERLRLVEVEREEELKKLKNVKKKEIKAKMKKVFKVAGFKKGDEVKLDGKDLDDEFDPVEYDKMMKAVFDDKYYGGEDSGLSSGEDDGEKPDFDKEDELLGLPKDWEVTQGGDGFVTARELALKRKEIVDAAGDDEKEEMEEEDDDAGDDEKEEEVEEEEEEEEKVEGKRKRKRKTSLVQRAQEALMEEYYKLDYEDTIGDLKTRFKYAKVQPNRFKLETEEILCLDDSELNQFVPLKKMAPYREKDWEVNKHKVREQKLKIKELLSEKEGKHKEKRDKKKKKHSDVVADVTTTKAAEEGETEESKLSRKAKRRRRQAEKKLPPNRMAAYGKTQ